MILRPALFIAILMTAPLAALAQDTDCDPVTTTCPDPEVTGVNVDP